MSASSRNNVRVSGRPDAQPMVLAHGFGCDQNMWRYITPAFEDEYRIILFDHVGAGGSDLSAYSRQRYSDLTGYARDVLEIIGELELSNVIFVGHSVSAMIGVLASNLDPEPFEKLVLVSPSPSFINSEGYTGGFTREDIEGLLESLDSNYLGWSSSMAPVIMGNPERPELGQELTDSFCRTDPEIARHFAHVTFTSDNRADLPQLKTRSLVLQCSNDAIAPQEVGEYVHQAIPDSEYVLLSATGHCPNLSAPDATVAAIKSFL